MIFHESGQAGKPVAVFIHGCFQPWESMLPIIRAFEDDYRVIIPALNGHTAECKSDFISLEKEAEEIESHILNNYSQNVALLCGLSMGGAIAYNILKNKRLKVQNAVLDGAPLVSSGRFLTKIMAKNYIEIARKSRARDKKTLENFSKNFLPEKYLQPFLSFVDKSEDKSIENVLYSVGEGRFTESLNLEGTKLLYLHGTKANESLAKKSAKLIAKHYPEATVVCFKGDRHIQCAIYEPDDWAEVVKDFIKNR